MVISVYSSISWFPFIELFSNNLSMFADVIFPQKLPALTYRVPADAPTDLVGRVVHAGLGRRTTTGMVISTFADTAALEAAHGPMPKEVILKPLTEIGPHLFSSAGIQLVQWLTDYYLTPAGLALKSCFFEEAIAGQKKLRKTGKPAEAPTALPPDKPDAAEQASIQAVADSLNKNAYQTWLYHAPATTGPLPFVSALLHTILSGTRGIMLLVPEFTALQDYAGFLSNAAGDRLAILHSRLTPNQRTDIIHRIRSGAADIILGTRSAVLAPAPNLSLIIVVDEQNPAYKAEEGVHYQGRDVAVMRGYLEKASVLLASSCPSLESSHNVRLGKYQLLDHQKAYRPNARRPEIRVVRPPSRKERIVKLLAPDIVKAVRAYLKTDQHILFLINRKGYSLLQCHDCAELIRCATCSSPMVFQKTLNRLECRSCVTHTAVPSQCPSCAGVDLRPFGAGTERIREELAALFGQDASVIEKDHQPEAGEPSFSELTPLIVGTEYAVHAAHDQRYRAAVVLSLDATLAQPDFRAHERTFQDMTRLIPQIKPGGIIFIQTRNDREPLVRAVARLDYEGFLRHELAQRSMVNYPPFSRLINVSVYATKQSASPEQRLTALLERKPSGKVEILGPLEVPSGLKGYTRCWRVMIKSSDRRSAGAVARRIQQFFDKERFVRVMVDVDPYMM